MIGIKPGFSNKQKLMDIPSWLQAAHKIFPVNDELIVPFLHTMLNTKSNIF